MDTVTKRLGTYVRDKGINISKMSRDTGIPYISLHRSLTQTDNPREIRGKELLKICQFLDVNPMDFADRP